MDVLGVVKRSPHVFPLACIAALAMLFVSEGSSWQSRRALQQLGEIQAARNSLQGLAQGILDAESGQRGYLLTSRQEYLQPYTTALGRIDASFRSLSLYYAADPYAMAVLGRLQRLTETKLSELALTLRLHDQGKTSATIEITLTDIGKEKMEAIRLLGAELLARETLNAQAGRDEIAATLMLSRMGVAALTLIGLLGLFLYLRQTAALARHEHELKRLLQNERDGLEIEVRQRTHELTELTRHLQSAREDERSRLARNLHDDLGALLTSAKLDAARIKPRLAGRAPEALEPLAHLVTMLNSSIALGRRIIEDLRPTTLENLGLVATLEILARDFQANAGVEVHCALAAVELDLARELMVYRLVQEGITNLSKYAQASQVWIELATHDGFVVVSVRDNGVGFNSSVTPASAYGLMGMRFRVQAEGGALRVVSAPGHGTLLEARLPPVAPGHARQPEPH